MSAPRLIALAPGLLAVVLAAAVSPAGKAGGLLDSPEAKLRAKIADLHAEVALLEVECAASRANLLERLKEYGRLELVDKESALSQVKGKLLGQITFFRAPGAFGPAGTRLTQEQWEANLKPVLNNLLAEAETRGDKNLKEKEKLATSAMKGGGEAEKAFGRWASLDFQAQLDAVRAQTDRMKADFLKKTRQLHVKKMELVDAEAEYKATRS
jgi:hypothetical protein